MLQKPGHYFRETKKRWRHSICQRQILHIHWSQHVPNAEISARTGLPPVMDFIRRRRLSVFGHIARLTQGTPAHNALHCQVGLASGRSLGRDWRRRPGRSVRECIFYVFFQISKNMTFCVFFEMTFQKTLKSHKKYQVCRMSIEILASKLIGIYHT